MVAAECKNNRFKSYVRSLVGTTIMSFIDWIRGLPGKTEKTKETETRNLVISTPEYKSRISSDAGTEDIWGDRGKTSASDTVVPAVTIDISEYDSKDIVSAFRYACKKYGDLICENPERLKNIMADLAPTLRSECKLLVLLSKSGNMKKALLSSSWEEADLLLWLENTVSYLVHDELIDELTARLFSRKILEALSGKSIIDKRAIEVERQRKQAEEDRRRNQKEAERNRREKLKAQQEKEEQEKREKETLDELRRRLAIEEKARKDAEAKALAHEKLKREAEARLEEEKKKRESEKLLEIRARLYAEEKVRKAESERKAAEELAKAERQKRELTELLSSINAQTSAISGPDPTTAKGLYEKYHNSGEKVIIVADSWHGDFCFVVDQIVVDGGQYKARGACFRNGMFYKNYTYPATGSSYKFSLYKGPSKEKINAAYGIKMRSIQTVSIPSNVASFALSNICSMTGRKPWGIDIEGTVLKAVHWTKLVETAAEHIMRKYGTKETIKKLGDSSYGNGYAYYFHNGRFGGQKYVYYPNEDISIMQGGSNDAVDVIVDLCKHFKIKLSDVRIYYR